MWRLHLFCKTYQQNPADQLAIDDNWLAWDFNQAVMLWGNYIDGELDKCKTQGERERKLKRLLGVEKDTETMRPTTANLAAQLGIPIIPKKK